MKIVLRTLFKLFKSPGAFAQSHQRGCARSCFACRGPSRTRLSPVLLTFSLFLFLPDWSPELRKSWLARMVLSSSLSPFIEMGHPGGKSTRRRKGSPQEEVSSSPSLAAGQAPESSIFWVSSQRTEL
jgi:hypothetical protein